MATEYVHEFKIVEVTDAGVWTRSSKPGAANVFFHWHEFTEPIPLAKLTGVREGDIVEESFELTLIDEIHTRSNWHIVWRPVDHKQEDEEQVRRLRKVALEEED